MATFVAMGLCRSIRIARNGDGWVMARQTQGSDLSRQARSRYSEPWSINQTSLTTAGPHLMRTYCTDPISTFLSSFPLPFLPFRGIPNGKKTDYFPTWTSSSTSHPLVISFSRYCKMKLFSHSGRCSQFD